MKITKLETTSTLFRKDKKMIYIPLFIFLIFSTVIIDACCLGVFSFNTSSVLNTLLIAALISLAMIGLLLFAVFCGTETQVLMINKFEHMQSLSERYKLMSYVAVNEIRAYVYAAAVLSIFMGTQYMVTETPINAASLVFLHVIGFFVLAKPFGQPEFFVRFMSDEYYLLLAKNYYNVRKKDHLSKIKEVLK